jgi:hypothetical protein
MLIVSATGSTNITTTLYENCSNKVNPYFLFELVRKGSNDEIIFTNDDISTAPWYWNEFVITIATTSIGLTQGIIPLKEGEYKYTAYEMANQYDLNISNAVGIVETGLLVCGLDFSAPVSVNTPYTIPVFRPNL